MSEGRYTYSVLQYQHSQLLGEVLNIGLLIYFPSTKHLAFRYPEKLGRLKDAYTEVSEKTIKAYYNYFCQKVLAANSETDIFSNKNLNVEFRVFLSELLPQDSSSLQFSEIKTGVLYTTQDNVIDDLERLYLSEFYKDSISNDRIDEAALLANYKKQLKEIDPFLLEHKNKIHLNGYTIQPHEGTTVKFDLAWQNGHLNLIKPASFDFLKADTIQRKAWRYFGQFTDLEEYAEDNNYHFDLLIAKPKKKELLTAFNNAIRLLEKPKHVGLVFEDELLDYSKKTIYELSKDDKA